MYEEIEKSEIIYSEKDLLWKWENSFEVQLWSHILKALKESDDLSSDKEFVLELVNHIQKIRSISDYYDADRDDGCRYQILKNISQELQEDKQFMKEVIKLDGFQAFNLFGVFEFDKDFLMESMAYCRKMQEEFEKGEMGPYFQADHRLDSFGDALWGHIEYVLEESDDLRSDKEFVLEVLQMNLIGILPYGNDYKRMAGDNNLFNYLSEDLQNDPELIALASSLLAKKTKK